jgi:hypothetical protein
MRKWNPFSLCLLCGYFLLAACTGTSIPNAGKPLFIPELPPAHGQTKKLTEFTTDDLRVTFGAPAFVRKEGGNEIWRYDVGACRIFFFFYKNGGGLEMRQIESVPDGHPGGIDRNCFNALELRLKKS